MPEVSGANALKLRSLTELIIDPLNQSMHGLQLSHPGFWTSFLPIGAQGGFAGRGEPALIARARTDGYSLDRSQLEGLKDLDIALIKRCALMAQTFKGEAVRTFRQAI